MKPTKGLELETLIEALDALDHGITLYGPDGRNIFINKAHRERHPAFCKLLETGATHKEAIEVAVRTHWPDASDEKVQASVAELQDAYERGEPKLSRGEDGTYLRTQFRTIGGNLKAGISVDITEQVLRQRELKKAKEAAEAANKAKTAFLANMSHEIRTPLNAILGMAQVIENNADQPEQRDQAATIIDAGQSLMAILNDVLDLSKIEAGKFAIDPTNNDIASLLRQTQKLWKPRAAEKQLDLILAADCDVPDQLRFDAVRFQQCLSNLISNAIKFTDTGRVSVCVRGQPLSDGRFRLVTEVSDTGAGMEEAILSRLFTPFSQADETISREHGGTGLGLSITRRLAEIMGGTAYATSEPGRGSTFLFSLIADPCDAEDASRTTSETQALDRTRQHFKDNKISVLIVDDQPVNRQVVSLFLRPYAKHLIEVVNGAEALSALDAHTFDLVLLDMHMPVMDGPTTIKAIRSSKKPYANIPALALTADAMTSDKQRYLAMGLDGYLAKPLAETALIAELGRVLGNDRRDAETPKLSVVS